MVVSRGWSCSLCQATELLQEAHGSRAGSLDDRDQWWVSLASDLWVNGAPCISSSAVVMFLVEEAQRNIFDQRCVENELWDR